MSTLNIKFGSYDFTDSLESWTEDSPNSVQTAVAIDKEGVLVATTAFLGPKTVRVAGVLAATNAASLRTTIDSMAAAFKNGRQKMALFNDRYAYALNTAFDYSFMETPGLNMAAYNAEFLADDPYWSSETLSTSTVTDATNSSFDVTNGGNAPACPVVTLTAQSTTSYVKIANDTRNEYFEYSGALAPGDVLEVDSLNKTVKKNGANDIGHFTNDFLKIDSGANTISYTGPTNQVQIAWRNRWY